MKIIFTGVSNLPKDEYPEAVKAGLRPEHYFYMSETMPVGASIEYVMASFDGTLVEIWMVSRDPVPEFYWKKACFSLDEARKAVSFITGADTLVNVDVMTQQGFTDQYQEDRTSPDPAVVFNHTIRVNVDAVSGIGADAVANWLLSIFKYRQVPVELKCGDGDSWIEDMTDKTVQEVINGLRERGVRVEITRSRTDKKAVGQA
jgi:hypothetical protein